MLEIGIRQARAELAGLVARVAAGGAAVMLTRHGRPAAALLPAAAVDVWERHQAEQAARAATAAELAELGGRLPGRATPACPHCRSTYLQVIHTGPVVAALVNLADPASGVQAVTVSDDVGGVLDAVTDVYCASCWEPMGTRPRSHGYPARQAAIALTEDGPWPARPAWEVGDHADAHNEKTRAGALVVAHDLARGVLRRVTTWEWLTGITDEQRARIRAEHPDDPD